MILTEACIPQTRGLQVFRNTQPCLWPMWIQVTSQVRIRLRFISSRSKKENFFDSYGAPPSKYSGTFTTFLNNNSNQWIFNTVTLQSIYSKVCGHYCLYFALYRSRQISMSTIVHRFSNNTRKNDSLVKRFIEKHFPISLPKYRTDVNKQRAQAQHNVQ